LRIAGFLVTCLCLGFSGCGAPSGTTGISEDVPPGTALRNHFKTSIPAGVTVKHYYCDAFKDPQFLWVLAPVDQNFLNGLIADARLRPAPVPNNLTPLQSPTRASWWDEEEIGRISELYYRDPDPNDGSYYRVWVDREHDLVYIQFSNT
jgi:hypothetical protein